MSWRPWEKLRPGRARAVENRAPQLPGEIFVLKGEDYEIAAISGRPPSIVRLVGDPPWRWISARAFIALVE